MSVNLYPSPHILRFCIIEVGDHCLMRQSELNPLPTIHVNTICRAYLLADEMMSDLISTTASMVVWVYDNIIRDTDGC